METKLKDMVIKALKTFKDCSGKSHENFICDLNELKCIVDNFTAEDLPNFKNVLQLFHDKNLHYFNSVPKRKVNPVGYKSVYENRDVTIGVFMVLEGSKLPLHDHPSMYGFLKVLQGVLRITSYSVLEIDSRSQIKNDSMFYKLPLKVIKHPVNIVTDKDSCCFLTPTERNIHQVECIQGPAAFLDILSPPYELDSPNESRSCHYFEELLGSDNNLRLIQIDNPTEPESFWLDEEEES